PLAALQEPRAVHRPAERLLRLAGTDEIGGPASRLTSRTAVYGPVRTVVWEGRSREAPPYPDWSPHAKNFFASQLRGRRHGVERFDRQSPVRAEDGLQPVSRPLRRRR